MAINILVNNACVSLSFHRCQPCHSWWPHLLSFPPKVISVWLHACTRMPKTQGSKPPLLHVTASGPSHTELLSGQAYNPGTWELPRQDEPPLAIGSCCPGRKKGRPSCAPAPTGKPTIVWGCLSFTCFRKFKSGVVRGSVELGTW